MPWSISDLRFHLLRLANLHRLRPLAAGLGKDPRLPVFVCATRQDAHLAPMAVLHSHPRIRHIILANALSAADTEWLRQEAAGVPVVRLKASLRGDALTYFTHAELIRLSALVSPSDFCVQDADCFVTESAWWEELRLASPAEYAAAPFQFPIQGMNESMPRTFLILISAAAYRRRLKQGILPDYSCDLEPLTAQLRARGIEPPYFPEHSKDYFDTLQKQCLAAVLDGEPFRLLRGADQIVFHVGGSSYLTERSERVDPNCENPWALNAPYFYMRVLEFARFERFRARFANLYRLYGSSDKMLAEYSWFRQSKAFRTSELILATHKAFLETGHR